MIILNAKLNNVYGFKDFDIAFYYNKKIINKIIENDYHACITYFHYK